MAITDELQVSARRSLPAGLRCRTRTPSYRASAASLRLIAPPAVASLASGPRIASARIDDEVKRDAAVRLHLARGDHFCRHRGDEVGARQ